MSKFCYTKDKTSKLHLGNEVVKLIIYFIHIELGFNHKSKFYKINIIPH